MQMQQLREEAESLLLCAKQSDAPDDKFEKGNVAELFFAMQVT